MTAFIQETSDTRNTTPVLGPVSPPFHPDGMAGELHIPMGGNTGAGDNQPCFHLFGLGRNYLHFNSGWEPKDLPEGTYVHNR